MKLEKKQELPDLKELYEEFDNNYPLRERYEDAIDLCKLSDQLATFDVDELSYDDLVRLNDAISTTYYKSDGCDTRDLIVFQVVQCLAGEAYTLEELLAMSPRELGCAVIEYSSIGW